MNREYFRDFYYKTISTKVFDELNAHAPYDRALFLECDNGFLIEFVQANEIHGIDIPEIESVPIVKRIDAPDKVYDLVLLSEKDYRTYSDQQLYHWVLTSASRIIAIVGTKEYMIGYDFGKPLYTRPLLNDTVLRVFEFEECLRVYE